MGRLQGGVAAWAAVVLVAALSGCGGGGGSDTGAGTGSVQTPPTTGGGTTTTASPFKGLYYSGQLRGTKAGRLYLQVKDDAGNVEGSVSFDTTTYAAVGSITPAGTVSVTFNASAGSGAVSGTATSTAISGNWTGTLPTGLGATAAYQGTLEVAGSAAVPAPVVALSQFAGTYNFKGNQGDSGSFIVGADGKVTQCKVGGVVSCSGQLTVDAKTGIAAFQITGNDGQVPVDTQATLTGAISAEGQLTGSYSGTSRSEGAFSGTLTGSRTGADANGASAVMASGSINYAYRTSAGAAVTGGFEPNATGFETDVTDARTILRWVNLQTRMRVEVTRLSNTGTNQGSKWAVALYKTGEGYSLGVGDQAEELMLNCEASICEVAVEGGTAGTQAVKVTFKAAGSTSVTGSLSATTRGFYWQPADLPRSSSGLLSYGGTASSVLTAYKTTERVGDGVSYTAILMNGASVTASRSSTSNPPSSIKVGAFPGWSCGWNSAACPFSASKRGDGTTRVVFDGVTISQSGATPSQLVGDIVIGQATSSLTVNGEPFSIADVDEPFAANWLATKVSAIGDTLRYGFGTTSTSQQLVVAYINLWVKNGVVTQLTIPAANGSAFVCFDKAAPSTGNWWTKDMPAHTVPACPGLTAQSALGDGIRTFVFQNFTLNVAPSQFATPTKTLTLNGVLTAKGL